ncbi:hypothetical protein B2G88_16690 [Natronolimnobius baerhuensis]|uniref:Uncharacterized protein n=1 Tax=Natronolimnobius baerhuensis TaxID=253108 RepID=A0A202E5U0_9EURY|nr:hypothetical protein B2G88_16690 [Natronolimnobius baerhuensis]
MAVEPRSAVGSALLSETRDAVSVSQNRSPDGTCRSTATVCTDETCEPLYVEQQTPNTCVCSVLDAFDCVYSIDAVEHGNLVVTVTLEDRHQLSALIERLTDSGASVTLRHLTTFSDDSTTTTTELETSTITAKQWEAIELAVELDYYEQPRGVTLAELADRLEISVSAVSQRLTAVESTVIPALVDQS